jgi:hypothetical protein
MKRVLWICILLLSLSLVGCTSQAAQPASPAPTETNTIGGHDPVWEKATKIVESISFLVLDTKETTRDNVVVKFQFLDAAKQAKTFAGVDYVVGVEIIGKVHYRQVIQGWDERTVVQDGQRVTVKVPVEVVDEGWRDTIVLPNNAKPMSITSSADWVSIPMQYLELKDVDRSTLQIRVHVKGTDINVTAEAPLKIPE